MSLGRTFIAGLLLLGAGCAGGSAAAPGAALSPGQSLPAFSVRGLDGKTLNLADLRGKVVLLDLWATWCEPCKAELPLLDGVAARLKGRGVEIVAVSIDEQRSNVDAFLSGRKTWSIAFAHDPDQTLAERLQVAKMPTSFVIDKAGIVRHVNSGFVPEDAPKIEAQLAELAQ